MLTVILTPNALQSSHLWFLPFFPFAAGAVEETLCARDVAGEVALLPVPDLTDLIFLFYVRVSIVPKVVAQSTHHHSILRLLLRWRFLFLLMDFLTIISIPSSTFAMSVPIGQLLIRIAELLVQRCSRE